MILKRVRRGRGWHRSWCWPGASSAAGRERSLVGDTRLELV